MMLDRTKQITCPCCGRAIAASHAPIEALMAVPMSPTQKRIVEYLASIYPRSCDINSLVDAVWLNDPEGGPLTARRTMHVQLCRLRKALPEYGWQIPIVKGDGFGAQSFYRLEPIA